MSTIDPSELDWVRACSDNDTSPTGFDAEGWESSVWVLHPMYEHPRIQVDTTWDEWHKHEVASGRADPLVIGGIDLDQETTTTGIVLGGGGDPSPDWLRLRRETLAARLEVTFDSAEYPPCNRWFPYTSWPVRIRPPCEGSLERADLRDLVSVLARPDGGGLVVTLERIGDGAGTPPDPFPRPSAR